MRSVLAIIASILTLFSLYLRWMHNIWKQYILFPNVKKKKKSGIKWLAFVTTNSPEI